jgi:ribosome maturation factor RimP
MINKNRVKELIDERINELNSGLFVVDLAISPKNVISVELDKMGGNVSINDCMSVSRNVEHNLNREEEDFEIQVSSAGLDKPFRVLDQYIKNIGRPVKVVLKEGAKTEGLLIEADAEIVVLEIERLEKIEGKKKKEKIKECLTFQMSEIKETKVVVLFK